MDAELTNTAIQLAGQGYYVFPVKVDGKDKTPLIKEWQNKATNQLTEIPVLFDVDSATHVGIACGPSKLVVIDVDLPEGEATLSELQKTHGVLPDTLGQQTPSGGVHIIYKSLKQFDIRNSQSRIGKNLDVRADGGFIVYYGWANDLTPQLCNPLYYYRMVANKYGLAALDGEAFKVVNTTEGSRNGQLNESALKLGHKIVDGNLDENYVRSVLMFSGKTAGLEEEECKKTIESGISAAKEQGPKVTPASGLKLSAKIKWYSDVVPKPMEWYDKPWLPKKGLVGLAGPQDVGKSTYLAYEIAMLTTEHGIRVLYFSTREEDESVVQARLRVAGADLKNIGYFTMHEDDYDYDREITVAKDLTELQSIVKSENIKAVYLDPGTSYLGIDESKDSYSEIRGRLEMLKKVAEQEEILIRFIKHTKKAQAGTDKLPLDSQIYGSQAWTEVSRPFSILWPANESLKDKLGIEDSNINLLLLRGKNNFAARDQPAKAFNISAPYDNVLKTEISVVKYIGEQSVTNDDIVEKGSETKIETQTRKEGENKTERFLVDFLLRQRQKTPPLVCVPAKLVQDEAEKQGIKAPTLRKWVSMHPDVVASEPIEGASNNAKAWRYLGPDKHLPPEM